ncbi:glycosyhydrolase [Paraflavitalea soli]|uniref:Glycosyhydrolase n=1 Tax=Paraflavitalea soli TaxID=2315862 RepID=A0A3B7MUV7_9BACT|nr:glycosyl hydrolase 115 family protein [Paraflavitalea soli]AXY77878.1 glycosyhydrolase [Paraflavitalea soli]
MKQKPTLRWAALRRCLAARQSDSPLSLKQLSLGITLCLLTMGSYAQSLVDDKPSNNTFSLAGVVICVDPRDEALVQQAAKCLQQDIEMVTGVKPSISSGITQQPVIIIGTLASSSLIKAAGKERKLPLTALQNKWEGYLIQTAGNRIVIAGSDRRGAAYGVFELSKQLGISPWYWWADVPVIKKKDLYIKKGVTLTDAPKVKYRGIFINDEAPALSGWSKEKFGGFNHLFYEKVFELILRLKGNYLWPAMWGNAFYDDDSLNIKMADRYGIVIGTSHHEPLMRAHDEWRRYGKGKWNYDSNEVKLKEFWRGGMQRATNEKIVSIGMRGDGDEPMSRQTATALLERIVKDQRQIIEEVTRKPASETPQLWALYKEVQDYYDKGMRVPDDVTLLLCDDNWGNIRKLPKPDETPRKGGYGIYYHFDYVGGPRNYKWLNTNPIARVWEQMHLAWEYKAREIWIVNVGDIKPMEFPISFFLDYAWNPDAIGPADLQRYTERWAARQFGAAYASQIADIISRYTKYNGRRKPELLDANTYSLATYEWEKVVDDYNELLKKATAIGQALPAASQDAYFQLVLHPVKACANLYEMYYNVALNKAANAHDLPGANIYADKVKELYANDSIITAQYHSLNNGKWNQMMSQTHIGYTYWQQPNRQSMPEVKYMTGTNASRLPDGGEKDVKVASIPASVTGHVFYEVELSGVSIGADHYTRAINTPDIKWQVLSDHGRTGAAITPFPVTAKPQKPGGNSPHLEYDIYTFGKGEASINAYFSPTLNFHNTAEGLQYAISVDDEAPQIISINKEDSNVRTWEKWVANNIIIKTSSHVISQPGRHVVKYWMVSPAVVVQKLVVKTGKQEDSYLGPPETRLNRD